MLERPRISIPEPKMQIDFSFALSQIRSQMLQEALGDTVQALDLSEVDRELSTFASKEALSALASRGLRGELLFAVPCVLQANPKVLGYYRLLLGFSQKSFYTASFGLTIFKALEESGRVPARALESLDLLCEELNTCAKTLLYGIGVERITRELLDDLTLITLGPQLRGGTNVRLGSKAIATVFEAVHDIVKPYARSSSHHGIEVVNAAGRRVSIEFASDPDIRIREELAEKTYRNVIAIEIKGGTDFSNIHNRIGEAEKSHQKARAFGYVECWTVVNVPRLDKKMAHQESPSTNRFYQLQDVQSGKGAEYEDFRNRIVGLTGIPGIANRNSSERTQ